MAGMVTLTLRMITTTETTHRTSSNTSKVNKHYQIRGVLGSTEYVYLARIM